jgi:hypothetical protein
MTAFEFESLLFLGVSFFIESVLSKTDWSFSEEAKTFREELHELAAKIRQEEMEKLIKRLLARTGTCL